MILVNKIFKFKTKIKQNKIKIKRCKNQMKELKYQEDFEQMSDKLYQKPLKQLINEKKHFGKSVKDICRNVDQRCYMNEKNKKHRIVSPYHRFASAILPQLKLDKPGLEFTEYTPIIAKRWGEMTADEKLQYQDQDTQFKTQKELQQKRQDEMFEAMRQKELKYQQQKEEQANQEQVTLDGYVYYAEIERGELKKNYPKMRVAEIIQKVNEKWEKMSDKQKQHYDREAYKFKNKAKRSKYQEF
ncbi:UNKNOWN [Stylonychia lemnae]|uniref:HMG box domain-containing protein n=1 Tax=Stylonychia lemnae TaxID=5949 RepID=A0A078B5N3_STYLE|nr:UNKNOWN [Stylonychia lemnae]|eukprot:CDW89516.1 UNKNOWN [Stylonychia lemnae]